MMVLIKIIIKNILLLDKIIDEYNKYYENIDVIVNDKGKVVLE